jgi:vacuolar-type H+-ATPase subunit I/STV1
LQHELINNEIAKLYWKMIEGIEETYTASEIRSLKEERKEVISSISDTEKTQKEMLSRINELESSPEGPDRDKKIHRAKREVDFAGQQLLQQYNRLKRLDTRLAQEAARQDARVAQADRIVTEQMKLLNEEGCGQNRPAVIAHHWDTLRRYGMHPETPQTGI